MIAASRLAISTLSSITSVVLVAALAFAHENSISCRQCVVYVCVEVKPHPPHRSDPAPVARKGEVAKQRGLDAERIETRHVAAAFYTSKAKRGGNIFHAPLFQDGIAETNELFESIDYDRFMMVMMLDATTQAQFRSADGARR